MDPVSFAIGVVSLASIVSTCIEGFHIFKSIRGYEHDAETIMLKLEIERALFITWAQGVGLLRKHHVNVTMFTPETDKLVYDVIVEIRKLLNEAETLARKYGLIEGESWKSCFDSDKTTTGGWCHCDRHRTKHRHRPQPSPSPSRSGDGNSSVGKTPLSRKFMWTIHTKAEFESIIEQLHYFIERLDQMVKSVNQRQMLLKELRGLGADFSKLDLIEANKKNSNDDKWSVQSSDGRSSSGYDEDWSDVMTTTFAGGCGGGGRRRSRRPDDDLLTTADTSGRRTGHRHSRDHRSGRHRNDYDSDSDPPPPYTSSTSLSRRRCSSPSSSKSSGSTTTTATTTIYTLSDRGSRGSSSSSSRSRRPSSWLSGSSDFY